MPAERTIWPPRPGLISTLWISVPTGMFALMGSVLPGLMSAVLAGNDGVAYLQIQRSQDVALLAVRVVQQSDEGAAVGVILDMLATFAGMSILSRLKSIMRYLTLLPPP